MIRPGVVQVPHAARQGPADDVVEVHRRLVHQHLVHQGHRVVVHHLLHAQVVALLEQLGGGGEAPARHHPPPPSIQRGPQNITVAQLTNRKKSVISNH